MMDFRKTTRRKANTRKNTRANKREKTGRTGSALLVTLLVMSLLLMITLGFTALVRQKTREMAATLEHRAAVSNARLGLMLAVSRLQEELGDDRRITAPANLRHPDTPRSQAVGVWESSLSPLLQNPLLSAPDYDAETDAAFRGWLLSHPDPEQSRMDSFINLSASPAVETALFTEDGDGHPLAGYWVPLADRPGRFAWAVTDEGIKARLNLGEDAGSRNGLEVIAAPAGPHLGLSSRIQQPMGDWSLRKAKITGLSSLAFDSAYGVQPGESRPTSLSTDFTPHSRTVLADAARGGLRTDLSMAFEMPDAEFNASTWGSWNNPFRNGAAPGGGVPLFTPANDAWPPRIFVEYEGRGDELRDFFTGAVPTYDHLRDHYRSYRMLAGNGAIPVRPQNSPWWDTSRPAAVGVSPVLNRLVVFFSLWVDPADSNQHLRLVLTPFIVLWNPYDVPIESPAFFVHQRLDFPVRFRFQVPREGDSSYEWHEYLGGYLGRGLPGSPGSGRSLDPYFLMQLTRGGTNNINTPIRIEPGEVRLFGPTAAMPIGYPRTGTEAQRTLRMKPVNSPSELNFSGGYALNLSNSVSNSPSSRMWTHSLAPTDRIHIRGNFARDRFHYMVTLEDAGRRQNRPPEILSEVMVYRGGGVDTTEQVIFPPTMTASSLNVPRPVALIETFNRTALDPGSLSNLLYTVNFRQRFANAMLSTANFTSGPHYQTDFRVVTDFLGSGLQVTPDAQRSFYGARHALPDGRDRLSFFELPRQPLRSLGGLQHADLVDTAFAPASPFGNSWPTPYLDRRTAAVVLTRTQTGETIGNGLALYDHSYLLNHALWDRSFFSTLAGGGDNSHLSRVDDLLANPHTGLPDNPRLAFWSGGRSTPVLRERLTGPSRALVAAAHMLLEGGFNINSTSEEAWAAQLSVLRGLSFPLRTWGGESTHSSGGSSFHRLSTPKGTVNDSWTGFRELDDDDIRHLARELVAEVRARGPFRSLGEFVNRRIGEGPLSMSGAVQAAIERAGLNDTRELATFDTAPYPYPGNISTPYTGVGLPGWLTQADVLQTIGGGIAARSDTFVVRAAGESGGDPGRGTRVVVEAVVQRVPEWVDTSQEPETPIEQLSQVNARFGRRFIVHSYRILQP